MHKAPFHTDFIPVIFSDIVIDLLYQELNICLTLLKSESINFIRAPQKIVIIYTETKEKQRQSPWWWLLGVDKRNL